MKYKLITMSKISNLLYYLKIFFGLLVTFAVFIISWGMAFTNINLKTSPKSTGIITSTSIKAGGKSGAFVFTINNNPFGYWIYRASGDYTNLFNTLKPGNEVTIIHSNIDSHGLHIVYQVQKGDVILYSKQEYEGKEKLAGRFIVLPGSVLMLAAIIRDIKKRIKKMKPIDIVES